MPTTCACKEVFWCSKVRFTEHRTYNVRGPDNLIVYVLIWCVRLRSLRGRLCLRLTRVSGQSEVQWSKQVRVGTRAVLGRSLWVCLHNHPHLSEKVCVNDQTSDSVTSTTVDHKGVPVVITSDKRQPLFLFTYVYDASSLLPKVEGGEGEKRKEGGNRSRDREGDRGSGRRTFDTQ